MTDVRISEDDIMTTQAELDAINAPTAAEIAQDAREAAASGRPVNTPAVSTPRPLGQEKVSPPTRNPELEAGGVLSKQAFQGVLNSLALNKDVNTQLKQSQKDVKATRTAKTKALAEAQKIDAKYLAAREQRTVRANSAFERRDEAMGNLADTAGNPMIWNRINEWLGDDTFNRQLQRANAQRAGAELERVGFESERATATRNLEIENVQRASKAAETLLKFDQDNMLITLRLSDANTKVSENIHKNSVRAIEALPIETLDAIIAGGEAGKKAAQQVPKEVRSELGLIRHIRREKLLEIAGVRTAQQGVESNDLILEGKRRDRTMSKLWGSLAPEQQVAVAEGRSKIDFNQYAFESADFATFANQKLDAQFVGMAARQTFFANQGKLKREAVERIWEKQLDELDLREQGAVVAKGRGYNIGETVDGRVVNLDEQPEVDDTQMTGVNSLKGKLHIPQAFAENHFGKRVKANGDAVAKAEENVRNKSLRKEQLRQVDSAYRKAGGHSTGVNPQNEELARSMIPVELDRQVQRHLQLASLAEAQENHTQAAVERAAATKLLSEYHDGRMKTQPQAFQDLDKFGVTTSEKIGKAIQQTSPVYIEGAPGFSESLIKLHRRIDALDKFTTTQKPILTGKAREEAELNQAEGAFVITQTQVSNEVSGKEILMEALNTPVLDAKGNKTGHTIKTEAIANAAEDNLRFAMTKLMTENPNMNYTTPFNNTGGHIFAQYLDPTTGKWNARITDPAGNLDMSKLAQQLAADEVYLQDQRILLPNETLTEKLLIAANSTAIIFDQQVIGASTGAKNDWLGITGNRGVAELHLFNNTGVLHKDVNAKLRSDTRKALGQPQPVPHPDKSTFFELKQQEDGTGIALNPKQMGLAMFPTVFVPLLAQEAGSALANKFLNNQADEAVKAESASVDELRKAQAAGQLAPPQAGQQPAGENAGSGVIGGVDFPLSKSESPAGVKSPDTANKEFDEDALLKEALTNAPTRRLQ